MSTFTGQFWSNWCELFFMCSYLNLYFENYWKNKFYETKIFYLNLSKAGKSTVRLFNSSYQKAKTKKVIIYLTTKLNEKKGSRNYAIVFRHAYLTKHFVCCSVSSHPLLSILVFWSLYGSVHPSMCSWMLINLYMHTTHVYTVYYVWKQKFNNYRKRTKEKILLLLWLTRKWKNNFIILLRQLTPRIYM
jgi:hypothetical protein